MIPLPPPLLKLINHLSRLKIKPILVGGFVRDSFTGHQTLDLDIELYGVTSLDALETALKPFGKVNSVGKSFGVFKLSYAGYSIDFSPPRCESKHDLGHKGFEITWFSELDFATAAHRRDFTINAIGFDPITNTFLDPYNGVHDLQQKILRCVDPETFVDDPLRVLRAVQFAARFDLTCDECLLALCQKMVQQGALDELPKERIFEEIKKLLLQSEKPSIGLKLLEQMGILRFFSPLDQLSKTPQDPLSHPEGSVWNHTLMCVDTMASLRSGEPKHDTILMLAALLHDIGKPFTTVMENNLYNAPKHAEAGVEIARNWLFRITEDKALIESVLPLIHYHGWPRKFYRNHAKESDILRLSTHVIISDLLLIAKADFYGRIFINENHEEFEAGKWLFSRADALGVLHNPPDPLLMGRDLIALGQEPSPRFKVLLDEAYSAQLDQVFSTREEALRWLLEHS
ncbi:MAG: HD domain-containing protein [Sulfuricurvum sp.]|nr:HD domain-containing protein [Sulfuricurvum sp.]